jgi:hypothetical protein
VGTARRHRGDWPRWTVFAETYEMTATTRPEDHRSPANPAPKTEGKTIRWTRLYDLGTTLLSFGQLAALHRRIVELAGIRPNERILDVGCGPYADGNGQISRLLRNLVLWRHHPPVYLKADKKGRHRYGQALRRPDHGDPKPLACLIAMSLLDIYDALLSALKLT